MMTNVDSVPRIRRPKDKEAVINRLLVSTGDGPFEYLRDVLIFAAAFGWYNRCRTPIKVRGEGIRWDVVSSRYGAEALVNMLALYETGDISILSNARFAERIVIFEEFANGGLEMLESMFEKSLKSSSDVIRDLVLEAGLEYHQEYDNLPELGEVDLSHLVGGENG